MFPSFISILDIQSWWEVPSIAHFCSLFRAAFNLLDFDIEDLEEALLTDGTEDSGSSLLQELIVRLLCGCLDNNDISTFNYQMFLRRLFRQKCQEQGRYNPFNSDVDFQFLPLRTKVEILHALCDFRLDAEDVLDLLKNLEAESLRVEPLGYDDNHSAYWYFYGTRLYREDYEKGGNKKNRNKQKSIWQVVCFTEEDWNHLTAKFKNSTSKSERALYLSLSENFLPEIPRLFQEKEKLQRKRLLELQPRRTSSRVQKLRELQESRQESAEVVRAVEDAQETEISRAVTASARELRALQRDVSRSSASEGGSSRTASPTMPAPAVPAASQTTAVGRQTNNSLASATGQIVIQPVSNPRRKKLKTSQVFRQTEEDLQTGMYKILEHVKNHEDAWPFIDPVEEDYAPNYYSVIRKPMDLQRMEDKLDSGEYLNFSKFKGDFQLIVDNCRLYNGTSNEYTEMVDNLQQAFERATEKYLDQISSSDEEIAVEFQDNSKDASVVNNHKSNKRTKKDKEGISNKKKTPHSPKQNNSKEESPKLKQTKQKRNESSEKEEVVEVTQQKKRGSREIKELKLDRNKRSKSPVKSSSNKKHKKVENKLPSRSMDRNRSVTKSPVLRRSWSHSPSPPPPVIHKKQKWKEKKNKKLENVKNKNSSEKKDLFEEKQNKSKSTHYDFSDEEREDIVKKYTELVKNSNTNFVKDKNSRLKETIEKLKQKSNHSKKKKELFLDDIFNETDQSKKKEFLAEDFSESSHSSQKYIKKKKHRSEKTVYEKSKASPKEKHDKKTNNEFDFDTEGSSTKDSYLHDSKNLTKGRKKVKKTGVIKNSDAIVALDKATEETLKDINKWLDDTPKFCEFSSPSNSPLTLLNNDDFDLVGSKIENDLKKGMRTEKPVPKLKEHLKDPPKRRILHKDFNKIQRRREVQRTIDRLQPGKSKGNLISNIQNNKMDESNIFPLGTLSKTKDAKNSLLVKTDETAPKLSLGSVLDSFGQQHNFIDDDQENKVLETDKKESELLEVTKSEDIVSEKKVPTVETESKGSLKEQLKQEKVTPNLSAWFKAFGAPKSTSQKKKNESDQELSLEKEYASSPAQCEVKPASVSPEENKRNVSPIPSPAPESPAVGIAQNSQQPIPRTRKASTGSSVSERSSFSQDMTDPLDSPRLSVDERLGVYPAPYPSPLHRSPVAASPVMASPHPDESQRQAAYPPISGAIRVGFYQDTVKNSPEKSCSPREQPQSPYQQYSQHVYTSNTSSTYQYNNPPSYPSQSPSQSPLYNRSESANPISYPVTSPSQSPPSFPCRSPSHSPIYTQSQPNTPHAVATSPSQSPIYTTQSQLQSSYNSVVNRAYFDTSKPLTDQYNSKLQNTAQYLSSVSETVKKLNTYTIDQTKQDNSHEQTENKNSEKPQQSNTVFPVKKRLYNENMSCEPAINRLSQNIQSAASMPGVNLSMFENNLLSGHQINIGPEQQQLNKELSDKLYSLSTGISVARTMDVNSMVASNIQSNSSYIKPSMGKSINNSISMNRSVGNVQGHIVEPNRGLNLHLGSNTNQPLNIPNPVKTIDLTGPDPTYPPTSSDIGSQSSHLQSERNLTNEMQAERNMVLTSQAIIQQMQQYQRSQDTFVRNNKTIETQSNQQMMLSPSVSLPDAQEMSSRGLSLNMNLHNQRMADLRIPNVRNEIDLHNLSTITNQNIIDQVTQRNEQNSRLTDTRITSANQSLNANISNANYKTTTSFTSSSPSVGIDTLGLRGNYSNLAHMVDRYPNDERMLSGLQTANSSFYADKALSSQHMFAKGISPSAHTPSTVASGLSIFSQPNVSNMSTVAYSSPSMQTSVKANTVTPSEKKSRKRKSKMQSGSPATDVGGSTTSSQGFQSYAELKCNTNSVEPSAISLKTASVVPGSAFNFGPAPPGIGLSASLYSDNTGFLDDYRNSTTNFYMPGTHHRSTPEVVSDKTPRNAHQSTASSTGSFPFLSRPQSRPPAYPSLAAPFINPHQAQFVDTSSPLYQQYLQRRQEELLRHSSVLHQGLLGPPTAYPPGYHAALGMRQPFDTRPSWL